MTTERRSPASGRMVAAIESEPSQVADDLQLRRGLMPLDSSNAASIQNSSIMIIDDGPIYVKVVRNVLQNAGCERIITTTEAIDALKLIICERPDVVILDINMPQVSGLEILEAMRAEKSLKHIPVLIFTVMADVQTKIQAFKLGATDFLNKPVDPSELVVRIRNMLTVKAHHDHLAICSARLEHEIRLRTAELESSRQEILHILACAAEYRDQETGNHVIRVGRYSGIIADQLGWEKEQVELIEQAAVLHDVGKIGISDSILLKLDKLDPGEIELIKHHCEYGMNILRGVPCNGRTMQRPVISQAITKSPVLTMAATIAMSHHEKWDGSGYPLGSAGELIPIEGRITALADVFDALSSQRPYKSPFQWEKCCEILEEERGQHFDPNVLDAFFARTADVQEIRAQYADNDESRE